MKTVSIEHLTRVEGNGGVAVTIDGKVVTDVKFNIYEGPRLIERLTVGRTPDEDVSLAPRICAICSVSHKNAVLRAMEDALGVAVSPKVTAARELMHMGEMIESHALHLFLLSLPDYLGYPNAVAMAGDYDREAKLGLALKQFGNHIMKVYTGRYIHGENPIIGGFGKYPEPDALREIRARAAEFLNAAPEIAGLFCELDYPASPEAETLFACCEPGDGSYGFWGEEILLSNGKRYPKADYTRLTNEFIVPHSYAKRSRYDGKPFSVGALARVVNLGERFTGVVGDLYAKSFNQRWTRNPLYHNASQALELVYCLERILELVDRLLEEPENPPPAERTRRDGAGTGLVEAPRGLWVHHYEVSGGLVAGSDIVTPTAMNAEDIERYCQVAAQNLLDDGKADEIRQTLGVVVRAFDPCISCSAHAVEVSHQPACAWESELERLQREAAPLVVGVGVDDRGDDGLGPAVVRALQVRGYEPVIAEAEWRGPDLTDGERPIVFVDAMDFGGEPGDVTLLGLRQALNHTTLSHRLLPFVGEAQDLSWVGRAYLLGVQPGTTEPGSGMTEPVSAAVERIAAAFTADRDQ
ncbi:MAG: hydrogenase maturation protease [Candidatus Eisenbacteria bacterium]|nr:hydrogenase maturation protease [Candidatus Eisenbacteria bacterium]